MWYVHYTRRMCCEISELFNTADVFVAWYLICSLQQTYVLRDIWIVLLSSFICCEISDFSLQQLYVLRDIWVVHYSRRICCEISKLFIRGDVCVARYLSCSLEQTYVLRDIWVVLFSRLCVAVYLSCSLEQTYELRDIWVVLYRRRMSC